MPGVLNGALRLAVAAGIAIAMGLAVRAQPLTPFPGVHSLRFLFVSLRYALSGSAHTRLSLEF